MLLITGETRRGVVPNRLEGLAHDVCVSQRSVDPQHRISHQLPGKAVSGVVFFLLNSITPQRKHSLC